MSTSRQRQPDTAQPSRRRSVQRSFSAPNFGVRPFNEGRQTEVPTLAGGGNPDDSSSQQQKRFPDNWNEQWERAVNNPVGPEPSWIHVDDKKRWAEADKDWARWRKETGQSLQ